MLGYKENLQKFYELATSGKMSSEPTRFGIDTEFAEDVITALRRWLELPDSLKDAEEMPVNAKQYRKILVLLNKYGYSTRSQTPKTAVRRIRKKKENFQTVIAKVARHLLERKGSPVLKEELVDILEDTYSKPTINAGISNASCISPKILVQVWKHGEYVNKFGKRRQRRYWLPDKELPQGYEPYDALAEVAFAPKPETPVKKKSRRREMLQQCLKLNAEAAELENKARAIRMKVDVLMGMVAGN